MRVQIEFFVVSQALQTSANETSLTKVAVEEQEKWKRLGITEMRKTANRMNFGDVSSREYCLIDQVKFLVACALICEGFSFPTFFI